jgi:hypothetical protein
LVAGEYVPDRLGRLSGEVDLRDLGALAAEATLRTQAGLPGQLRRQAEPGDVTDFGGDREGHDPAEPGAVINNGT